MCEGAWFADCALFFVDAWGKSEYIAGINQNGSGCHFEGKF
jgi:hypothetical protein